MRLSHLLKVAIPLVIATGSVGIKLFFDRLMLAQYDEIAIRASMPSGILLFTLVSLLMGLVTYSQTLIAHYHGADQQEGIGRALKAGLIIALAGGALMLTGIGWSTPLFAAIGHEPAVQAAEVTYFNILCLGVPIALANIAFAGFWSGRSKTLMTMIVGILNALINIALNYWLIFGGFGIAALGIAGAAWGTVGADICSLCIYAICFSLHPLRKHLNIFQSAWLEESRRLIRFGLPAGIHRCLDLAAFTLFVQIVGRYPTTAAGANPQEAANITFAINALVFIPIVGVGTAVSILCGQSMGKQSSMGKKVSTHEEAAAAARHINRLGLAVALAIQLPAAALYCLAPDLALQLFSRLDDPQQQATLHMASEFLRYLAIFLICDGIWIVTGSALSGVGDTKFLMWSNILLAWVGFVVPMLTMVAFGAPLAWLWWLMIGWACSGAIILAWRWRSQQWLGHQVIAPSLKES